MNNILQSHAGEIGREIRANRFEVAPTGILLPRMGAFIGGALKTRLYAPDGELVHQSIDANLVSNEGLNHFLNAALPPTGGYAPITQWYVAPFEGNYTPDATLTAANFVATANEFEAYTNGTRPVLTIAAAASAQSTGNSGSEALFTMNAGGPYNLYGFAIVSSSVKAAGAGKLLAAVRLEFPMLNLMGGYKAGAEYVITAADAP